MIRALQVGDRGTPRIGRGLLDELKAQGVQGIRTDCQKLGAEETLARWAEIHDAGLVPLVTVYEPADALLLPGGARVEFRGEANIGHGPGFIDRVRIPPGRYRDLLLAFYAAVPHVTTLASGVANENTEGYEYFRALNVPSWPAAICCAWHYYPHGRRWEDPHPDWRSRDQVIAAFLALCRRGDGSPRPHAITEFGWHTAPNPTYRHIGPIRIRTGSYRWSDDQVAEFVGRENAMREDRGFTGTVLFQINDGPNPDDKEQAYGARRFDPSGAYAPSQWKPVMNTFRSA